MIRQQRINAVQFWCLLSKSQRLMSKKLAEPVISEYSSESDKLDNVSDDTDNNDDD